MKVRPTIEIFFYLIYGYSYSETYCDITILWGDIKSNMESGVLAITRDVGDLTTAFSSRWIL